MSHYRAKDGEPAPANHCVTDEFEDYLCIEPFLAHFVGVQALDVGLKNGLIDHLSKVSIGQSIDSLSQALQTDPLGLKVLCDALTGIGVLHSADTLYTLSCEFQHALKYRDLLNARIQFCNLLAPDAWQNFAAFVADFQGFMARSRVFELFRYDKCFELTDENFHATQRWVNHTSILTRYEAPVCTRYVDFGAVRKMLDVGGNSGEFVFQLCRRFPQMQADVFDLPVVCEVGKRHLYGQTEASRIGFVPGDALADRLPSGYDLVSFKSMLHDWPEPGVEILLQRASRALTADGTLMIFERSELDLDKAISHFGSLPMLLFQRNFRQPEIYVNILNRLGFEHVEIHRLQLDSPFFVLLANR